jgi:CRP-like cAMP-binding protein
MMAAAMQPPPVLDLASLAKYPIFHDLSPEEISEFVANTRVERYDQREQPMILKQGEQAHGLGILLAGKVKISRSDAAGREHFLSVLKEGDFFGEMALFSDSTRSANVEALEPATVLWLRADDLKRFVEGRTPLIAKILARMVADLSHRLRLLDERYVFIKGFVTGRAA